MHQNEESRKKKKAKLTLDNRSNVRNIAIDIIDNTPEPSDKLAFSKIVKTQQSAADLSSVKCSDLQRRNNSMNKEDGTSIRGLIAQHQHLRSRKFVSRDYLPDGPDKVVDRKKSFESILRNHREHSLNLLESQIAAEYTRTLDRRPQLGSKITTHHDNYVSARGAK